MGVFFYCSCKCKMYLQCWLFFSFLFFFFFFSKRWNRRKYTHARFHIHIHSSSDTLFSSWFIEPSLFLLSLFFAHVIRILWVCVSFFIFFFLTNIVFMPWNLEFYIFFSPSFFICSLPFLSSCYFYHFTFLVVLWSFCNFACLCIKITSYWKQKATKMHKLQ